ncbi:MAG: leucyl aminopeptidase, partial [Nocardioidaceae bacterium]|nr:leucyl aminopeptidase [Nocardioidaceae bacterium]
MTTFALRNASPAKTKAEAVVVGVLSDGTLASGGEDVAAAYGRKLSGLLTSLGARGRAGEVTKVPTGGVIASPLLVLVGMGEEASSGAVRRAAGVAARAVTNAASVAYALPADTTELVRAVLEGYRLGGYAFTTYKSDVRSSTAPAELVILSPGARRAEMTSALEQAQVVSDAVLAARDWVNTPPNDLTPPMFADQIAAAVKEVNKQATTKIRATVLDEVRLTELGCGGLLAVGAGSAAPSRMVELSYKPKDAVAHIALVGKGITFDSGGLWLKPAASMKTMKEDMGGAAVVVQAMLAAARLALPVRISVFVALAENMIGEAATRPGDVISTYDGTTVEISNTDAEGRLVLADAIGRAVEVKPDVLVDVATLTGHMVTALGDQMAGVLGDEPVVHQLLAAADSAGEHAWPMPLPDYFGDRIRS